MTSVTVSDSTAAKQFFSCKNQHHRQEGKGRRKRIFCRELRNALNLNTRVQFVWFKEQREAGTRLSGLSGLSDRGDVSLLASGFSTQTTVRRISAALPIRTEHSM